MYYLLASVPAKSDLIRIAVGAGVAFAVFIAASWFAAMVWVLRDVSSRTKSLFVRMASLAPVAMFSIPGLLPYVLMRPPERTDDRLQRQFDLEASRRELDQYTVCPRCRRGTRADFVACPYCRETLAGACDRCGKQVAFAWLLCPYCAKSEPQVARPAASRRRDPQLAPSRTSAARPQVHVP